MYHIRCFDETRPYRTKPSQKAEEISNPPCVSPCSDPTKIGVVSVPGIRFESILLQLKPDIFQCFWAIMALCDVTLPERYDHIHPNYLELISRSICQLTHTRLPESCPEIITLTITINSPKFFSDWFSLLSEQKTDMHLGDRQKSQKRACRLFVYHVQFYTNYGLS